jgi:hypothetical protein
LQKAGRFLPGLFHVLDSGISLGLLVAELLLPSEDASFVAGLLSFRDHSLALIGAGYSGPGEDVVRIKLEDASGGLNGAVKIFPGVVGLREAMKRVGEFRIERKRAIVFRDGFLNFSFTEEINSGVVMIFSVHGERCLGAAFCAAILPPPQAGGSRC